MAARWPLPAPGDIVWCRFPELPRQFPGPKPRPALVLEVIEREDGIEVTVVYGTSQRVDKLSAGEFAITRVGNAAAYKAAGLSHDTKFDFKQTARLPWSEEFFAVPPGAPNGQKPLIGTLHASVIRAAAAAHAADKQR
jgi:PemK-like, MazF-like toxin of type II toxin-antitoxin system